MIDTEKLLENISIKDVVETYTGQRVRNNKTLCPFHNDHTESLTLKTDKGIWRCWACGIGGNAINFTREFYGLSFIDACKKLSEDFKIDDVGIWDDSKADDNVWRQVEIEVRKERKRDLQQLQEEIESEIQTLMSVHRCLFHLGYYDAAERYAQEIEDLERYKSAW
jgi:DNA primase